MIKFKTLDINNNYNRIRKAYYSLSKKDIEFDINIPGSDKIERNITSIVSSLKYIVNSDSFSFIIPSSASHFFCYIGGGFTSIQKCIAINLKSKYSKSMYEFCCRWKDRGGYKSTIERLRRFLLIGDKYNQISHFRIKVLNVASQELKDKADYYFTYNLIKENSRKYTHIYLKIHKNVNTKEDEYIGVSDEQYNYIYNFLRIFYPNHIDNKAFHYVDLLAHNGNLNKAYLRFIKLDNQYTSQGKTKNDIINILNKSILPELKVIKKQIKSYNSHQK